VRGFHCVYVPFHAVANSGLVDRMFQVTSDQEDTILIGDMLSDGLLVVELPPSPASTPCVETRPAIRMSSHESQPPESPLSLMATAVEKRKVFGRNASYGNE